MRPSTTITFLATLLCAACAPSPDVAGPPEPPPEEAAPAESGPLTILLNESGREAMGIELAPVSRRARSGALDLPGRIELRPGARRLAAAPVDGRLSLAVGLLDEVAAGDVLFTLEAPLLGELRALAVELEAAATAQRAWLTEAVELELAHEAHVAALASLAERWERRRAELQTLREAAGGQAEALAAAETALVEARSRMAEAREAGAEHHAEAEERRALLAGVEVRREVLLERMAQLLGVTRARLEEPDAGAPRWRTATSVAVHATTSGVIDDLLATDGAWAHEGDVVLGLRRPLDLWLRGEVLQSELAALEGGEARGTARPADAGPGDPRRAPVTLRAGLDADPVRRTAELLAQFEGGPPAWARPGLAVRIDPDVTGDLEGFAVPAAAVRRDGLARGVWIQDPGARARLVFVQVVVLAEAAGWAWIEDEGEHGDTGGDEDPDHTHLDAIRDGTQVVVRGAGRLLLATRGAAQEGGHFHADGTFHAEDD